jgi:hypothetical protein
MSEGGRPAASAIAAGAGICACTWTASDTRLRRQRQCEKNWRLGARVLFELLDELYRHHYLEGLDRRLSRYAALDPEILQAVDGHKFPPVPLRVIRGQQ